ncbi:hypothetical protein P7C70_g6512, partial [Phenoliferia sp. Uapishka_3]
MPEIASVCGWNHCRQHVPDTAPGGIHRHYGVKHNGKYPPDAGYEEDWDEVEDEPRDDFQNHLFWEGAAQRRRDLEGEGVEGGMMAPDGVEDGSRQFRVERHPDAGWACDENGDWHPERDPPPRMDGVLIDPDVPYAPFEDARQWSWAERVTTFRMSRRQLDIHMKLHGEMEASAPAFTNFAQYRNIVDDIEYAADWATWKQVHFKVRPEDVPEDAGYRFPFLEKEQVFYFRNTDAVLRDLLSNPAFVGLETSAKRHLAFSSGLALSQPFYDSFGIDGHMLIISDLLHQLTKGCFKDITLDSLFKPYLLDAVGGGGAKYDAVMLEIERRLEVLPPCSKLRRFKNGINFKQWTGRHTKALMVIMSAPLWDLSWGQEGTDDHDTLEDEVPQSLALATVIYMYAASLESTATDRDMHAAAIELYNIVIHDTYQDERKILGFNWARLHSVFHYVEWTAAHGCAAHSDTSNYENAHIAAVKYPYRASNRCQATVQILRSNTRKDQMRALRNALELSGTIETSRVQIDPIYQTGRTVLPERGDRRARMRLPELAEARGLPALVDLTNAYLANLLGIPDFVFDGKVENHTVASASFPVYQRPAYLSNDTCKLQRQRIYSTEDYPYRGEGERVRGPRFDTILVKSESYAELHGVSFDAFEIARARMFYVVRYRGRRVELCLGEVYEKDSLHSASLPIMQPVVRPVDDDWDEPVYRVFAVEDILRSVLLQPLFGSLGVPKDLHFMSTLDCWRGSYAVAIFADQHIFRILFRPDAKKYIRALARVPWVNPGQGSAANLVREGVEEAIHEGGLSVNGEMSLRKSGRRGQRFESSKGTREEPKSEFGAESDKSGTDDRESCQTVRTPLVGRNVRLDTVDEVVVSRDGVQYFAFEGRERLVNAAKGGGAGVELRWDVVEGTGSAGKAIKSVQGREISEMMLQPS